MKNLKIYLPLVNKSVLPYDFKNGKDLIEALCGEVIPPPKSLNISIKHTDGKTYTIYIPFSDETEATLNIYDDKPKINC